MTHAKTSFLRPAAACLAAALLAAAGCGGDDDGSNGANAADSAGYRVELTDQQPAATKPVDSITWALPYGEPVTIDPIQAGDYAPDFMVSQMCDFLLRFNPKWELEPGLAESWDQPDDRTLVFKIRKGVKFWDGRPMTVDDVVYSLKRNLDEDAGSLTAPYFANVESMEASGPSEVTVRFKQPDELFLKEMAAGPGAVVQRDFTEKAGSKIGTAQGGVMCTGPYEFESWKPGAEIKLAKNDDYWDPDLQPKIANVTVRFLSETTTLTSALVSGEVAGAYGIPATSIPALQRAGSGTLYYGPSTQQLGIYTARPEGLMADERVRKALSLAIDRQAIAEKAYSGAAIPNEAVVSNTREQEAKDVYAEGWKQLPSIDYDLDAAKKQLDGVTGLDKPIVIAAPAGDQATLDVATLVQNAGKQIGLNVKIQALQPLDLSNFYYKPEYRKGFDGVLSVSFSDHPDPLNFLPYVIPLDAYFNYSGWDSPKAVRAMDEGRRTLDADARAKLLLQAIQLEADDRVTIPLLGLANISFISNDIGGAPTSFAYLWMPDFAYMGGK
ncbi:MAG: ABC transporter substrate-binding protein [Thermoleophilaceae bacterium]|nr:ABC transporter substrate-binding protein [Thermoleophilaceae bacterium]